jgi:hypothetical protein
MNRILWGDGFCHGYHFLVREAEDYERTYMGCVIQQTYMTQQEKERHAFLCHPFFGSAMITERFHVRTYANSAKRLVTL